MNYLFTGTYTKGKSKGIYVFRFDPASGTVSHDRYCPVKNPSYIVFSPVNKHIYSVSENETGRSYANAFGFNPQQGTLTLLNRRVTGGTGACHIAVDPRGQFAVTANYGGGSISVFSISKDGKLKPRNQNIVFSGKSVHKERQEASHPHCTAFSPDSKYAFVTDLGTDQIYRFDIRYGQAKFLDEESKKIFDVTPGSGPRHLVFHPNGKHLYLVNEISGTIVVFGYSSGNLESAQEIPIGHERQEGGGAIALSADGAKLFVSLREDNDGIAVYAVKENGKVVNTGFFPTHLHPRDIGLSPDGKYLLVAAMKENLIEAWKVTKDGRLDGQRVVSEIDSPTFVGFRP